MYRSLSVLLPVHNVQRSLCGRVHEILEMLAELSCRFELVIIDGGSSDGTWDSAQELARSYPQVRLLRFPDPRTYGESVRQLIHAVHSDVVIAHDGESPVDARQILPLWRSLTSSAPPPKLIRAAVHTASTAPRYPAKLSRGREIHAATIPPCGGFRMLRPAGIEELRRAAPLLHNVTVKRGPHSARVDSQPAAPNIDADAQTRRPNFLSRVTGGVRDFARGE